MINSNIFVPDLQGARERTEFEIVRALTRTARDVAGIVKDDLPRRFTLRRQWVVKGIRFDAASKANPVARVFSIDPYMLKQEEGESYTPSGQHVAIPVDVRQNPRSAIPPGMLPRNALNRRDVFKSVLKGSGPAIVQRKKDGIKILYLLRGQKVTKPRWGFAETAESVVEKRFTRNLV
jgi:hypothetical protein